MKTGALQFEKPLAVVLLAGAAVWTLIALLTWSELANGLRFSTPWRPTFYDSALLFEHRAGILSVAALVLHNLVTMIIGYALVVRPIWGHRNLAAPIWLVFAGAMPGTLMVIALSRIVTLLIPNTFAPFVIFALMLIGLALSCLVCCADRTLPVRHWRDGLWLGLAALVVALVIGVTVDQNHVTGEGSIWFIKTLFLSPEHGVGTAGRWPIVSQHYDEAAFLYPVVYGVMGRGEDAQGTFVVFYWVTIALGRLGVASLTYIAIRGFGLDRLSSLVLMLFFWAASLSLNPLSSILLFDSLSPLASAVHVARVLIPVAPLVILSAAQSVAPSANWRALAIAALLGIGFSSMPIHGVLVVGSVAGVLILAGLAPLTAQSTRMWQAACATCLVVLIAFAAAYGIQSGAALWRAGLLLAAFVAGVVMFAAALFSAKLIRPDWEWLGKILALLIAACGGYALGLLLLGNIFIGKVFPQLSHIWPWAGLSVLERAYSTLADSSWSITQSPYCEGYNWAHRLLAGHCATLPKFVRAYGLPFVVISGVSAWWLLSKPHGGALVGSRKLTIMFWGIAISLLALPLCFFAYDFVSSAASADEGDRQLSIWLRSRLAEPWFYSGTMLALILFMIEGSRVQRRAAQSIMLAAVAMFGMNFVEFPMQYIANFAYLAEHLIHR